MSPAKDSGSKEEVKVTKPEKRKKSEGSSKSEKSEQPKEKIVKKESVEVKKEKEETPTNVIDVYEEVLKIENEESEKRSGDTDLNLWKETCGELRSLMKDIFEMKIKNNAPSDIAEKRIQASLLFVTMKKLNRLEKLRLKKSRDSTNQAKQSMDSFNLQLQNLLYEVLHLKKEVTKCVNFKSADDNLSLIPTEEFYAEAPEAITNTEVTMEDAHAQRLARLQWELLRRKELSQEVEEREMERDKTELVIRTREDKLRDLGPQLSKILDTTKPVQQYLEMPLTEKRDQLELARLLPAPLYVMYSQCSAYSTACDNKFEVKVVGDIEEARRYQELAAKDGEDDEDEETGGKDDSQDADGDKTRRGGAKAKVGQEAVRTHPLSVELVVHGAKETSVTVSCEWVTGPDIVCGQVSVSAPVSGDMVSSDSILSHLTPGDSGLQSPNPASSWKLSQLGVTDSLSKLLPGKLFYFWLQRLAGLDFLESKQTQASELESTVEAKPEVSKLYMETIISSIRSRLATRLSLHSQLEKLSKHKVELSSQDSKLLPSRAVSKLKSWQAMDWESYGQLEWSRHLVSSGLVSEHCHLFKATVTRDKAVVTALVSVSPSHPTLTPLWCVQLKMGDSVMDQESSEVVRDMETEMNTQLTGLSLPGMMHKLLLLTDIVLEVTSEQTDDKFIKSQPFLDNVRGRMRRLPLHYNPEQQMFQQR